MTRRRNQREIENRLGRLESGAGMDATVFVLEGGAHGSIKRRELIEAVFEAATGVPSFRANILLHATAANDGNQLWSLAQSLAAGPIECNTSETN